jgi:hypothetical protein
MRSLREAVVELLPDCIKEHVEKFGSKFEALKFAGIMVSSHEHSKNNRTSPILIISEIFLLVFLFF